jgi:hypothetical protein
MMAALTTEMMVLVTAAVVTVFATAVAKRTTATVLLFAVASDAECDDIGDIGDRIVGTIGP